MDFANFYSNARVQSIIADNFTRIFQETLNIAIASTEIQNIQKVNEFEIRGLGVLRYFTNKKSYFTILGTSDINTYNYLHAIESQKLIELESLLLKSINESINAEARALGQMNEIKSMMVSAEDQISFFKKLESKQTLRLNFLLADESKLSFDLPLSTPSYLPLTILENTGFNEQTKILIVDDSKLNRLILKNYLLTVGFLHLEEASDGKEALLKVQNSINGYGLIIADWHMPEMSGFELLQKIRTNYDTKNTPFILATSEQKKEEVVEALKLKVSGYVVKPYSADMLIKSIKAASKNHK